MKVKSKPENRSYFQPNMTSCMPAQLLLVNCCQNSALRCCNLICIGTMVFILGPWILCWCLVFISVPWYLNWWHCIYFGAIVYIMVQWYLYWCNCMFMYAKVFILVQWYQYLCNFFLFFFYVGTIIFILVPWYIYLCLSI